MTTKTPKTGRGSPKSIAAGLMAFSSALFFVVFLFKDLGELVRTSWSDVPWGLLVRYLASMGLAGGLVGFALSGLFGRRGFGGWALAVVAGAVAATAAGLLGSLFGGLPDIVANGLDGRTAIAIGAGALVLPFAMADWPLLSLIWLVLLAITHLSIRRRRQPSGS